MNVADSDTTGATTPRDDEKAETASTVLKQLCTMPDHSPQPLNDQQRHRILTCTSNKLKPFYEIYDYLYYSFTLGWEADRVESHLLMHHAMTCDRFWDTADPESGERKWIARQTYDTYSVRSSKHQLQTIRDKDSYVALLLIEAACDAAWLRIEELCQKLEVDVESTSLVRAMAGLADDFCVLGVDVHSLILAAEKPANISGSVLSRECVYDCYGSLWRLKGQLMNLIQ